MRGSAGAGRAWRAGGRKGAYAVSVSVSVSVSVAATLTAETRGRHSLRAETVAAAVRHLLVHASTAESQFPVRVPAVTVLRAPILEHPQVEGRPRPNCLLLQQLKPLHGLRK